MQVAKKIRVAPTTVRSLNIDLLLEISHFLEGEDANDLFFVLRVWQCSPGEWIEYHNFRGEPEGRLIKVKPHVDPLLKVRNDVHDRSNMVRHCVLKQLLFVDTVVEMRKLQYVFEARKLADWMKADWVYEHYTWSVTFNTRMFE